MKHIKLFDAFINESELSESKLSYWKDYENSNPESPDWYNDAARTKIEVIKLLDAVVDYELGEMDDEDASIELSDMGKLTKLVLAYLKEFGSINGNVISAMLYQGA